MASPGRLGRLLARGWRRTRRSLVPRRKVVARQLAVAVAVRNRGGQRADNFLRTLRAQTVPERCVDITVCDFGSEPEHVAELRELCARHRCRLVLLNDQSAEWNKSLALNAAIRATPESADYLLPTDIDMLFAPNFVESLIRAMIVADPALVLCQFRDLVPDALEGNVDVVADFANLVPRSEWAGEYAVGPCLAATREWYVRVRGFDERMRLWGFMDLDIQRRAERDGLKSVWINDRTTLLHQWHPRKFDVHKDDPVKQAEMQVRYEANRRLYEDDETIVRNDGNWGALPPGSEVIEPPEAGPA